MNVPLAGHISEALPDNCVALLGRPTIRKLIKEHGLNIDFHLSQDRGECHDLMFHALPTRASAPRKRTRETQLDPPPFVEGPLQIGQNRDLLWNPLKQIRRGDGSGFLQGSDP